MWWPVWHYKMDISKWDLFQEAIPPFILAQNVYCFKRKKAKCLTTGSKEDALRKVTCCRRGNGDIPLVRRNQTIWRSDTVSERISVSFWHNLASIYMCLIVPVTLLFVCGCYSPVSELPFLFRHTDWLTPIWFFTPVWRAKTSWITLQTWLSGINWEWQWIDHKFLKLSWPREDTEARCTPVSSFLRIISNALRGCSKWNASAGRTIVWIERLSYSPSRESSQPFVELHCMMMFYLSVNDLHGHNNHKQQANITWLTLMDN